MKLFYLPLEPYKARYTIQLSRAKDGWFERRLRDLEVDYVRVGGQKLSDSADISTGVVLDAAGRSYWSLTQIANLIALMNSGEVLDGDAVYFEDFWTPGIGGLLYTRHLLGIDFGIYALLHAQSVDTFDFTYPMRHWMRYYELAQAREFDGIFVTNTILKHFLEAALFEPWNGIHVTGLPYASDEVRETARPYDGPKEDLVVFTSRLDKEKDPVFFLDVIGEVLQAQPDIKFAMSTSHGTLRSNDSTLVEAVLEAQKKYSPNLEIHTNLEKWEYYRLLQRAKVQFNCAHQDFTSWTLLEASTFGCLPCYPNWRSFPECFAGHEEYLYTKGNVQAAAKKILDLLKYDVAPNVSWIYKPYDKAAERMVNIMRGKPYSPLFPFTEGL